MNSEARSKVPENNHLFPEGSFDLPGDSGLIPKTLEVARLACSLSLSSLSNKSGISAPTLSRIETGSRRATRQELEAIAVALDVPVRLLCKQLATERLGLSEFYHRKLSRAGARAVRSIESQCLLNAAVIHQIVTLIDDFPVDSVPTIDLDDAKGDPELAAHMLRLAWRLPRGPIRNLFSTVENAGCLVLHTDFGIPDMDALYQKAAGIPPIFWVNSRKPLDRVRFSLAHELGHLVLHEERPTDNSEAERQADTFAAAFLMPKADFRSECPTRIRVPQLIQMKRKWRCSMSAIARRSLDTDIITPQQHKNLMIRLSQLGWRKTEPYPIQGESPKLMASIIHKCLHTVEHTLEEFAKMLAINPMILREWQQPFPGQCADPMSPPSLRLVSE